MDNEQLGTSAVIQAISKTKRLKPYINSSDKEPSFDGGIYIYDNENYSKKNIKRVAVQVKSKVTHAKVTDTIKYPITVTDLENYRKNGGVLFFVVYLDHNTGNTKQIYYSSLLPYKIREITNIKQANKRTISIKFYKFPSDPKEITEIFLNFYSNAQKQISFADKEIPTISDLHNQGVLQSLSISYLSLDNNKSIFDYPKMINGKEIYVYANLKGGLPPIPVEYHSEISHLLMNSIEDMVISVNGIVYYNKVARTITAEDIILKIGTSVTLVIPNISGNDENNSGRAKFTVKVKGDLNQRIRSLEFLIAVLEFKYIEINGKIFTTNFSEDEFEKLNANEYPEILEYYKRVLSLLNGMNVDKPLNLDGMDAKDFHKLDSLLEALENGTPIKNSCGELPFAAVFKIANIRLLMACKKTDDGNYIIDDYFGKKIDVYYSNTDECLPASQYSIIKEHDFLSLDNLNLNNIVNDFKRIAPHNMLVENGNYVMLEMLKAYDASKNVKFLLAAKSMSSWIESNKDKIDEEIVSINKYQIIRRERKLTFPEKRELYGIIERSEDISYKIGALILLDEYDEVKSLINTLPQNKKEELMSYPIFNLYHEEESQNGQT